MIIGVHRTFFDPTWTIGRLTIDGEHAGYSLEDVVRPFGEKVFGETAIPAGDYRIEIRQSSKFIREMPYLVDVPNFTNVMIHWGNTTKDTLGCILVGTSMDTDAGMIMGSRICFDALWKQIKDARTRGEEIVLSITGAP